MLLRTVAVASVVAVTAIACSKDSDKSLAPQPVAVKKEEPLVLVPKTDDTNKNTTVTTDGETKTGGDTTPTGGETEADAAAKKRLADFKVAIEGKWEVKSAHCTAEIDAETVEKTRPSLLGLLLTSKDGVASTRTIRTYAANGAAKDFTQTIEVTPTNLSENDKDFQSKLKLDVNESGTEEIDVRLVKGDKPELRVTLKPRDRATGCAYDSVTYVLAHPATDTKTTTVAKQPTASL